MIEKERIIEVLKTVEDPDLYLDIYFLGLIYEIHTFEDNSIKIVMTFTTPLCPAAPEIIAEIKEKVLKIDNVSKIDIEVVYKPKWEPNMEVKQMLGLV